MWHVPISSVDARLRTGELRMVAGISEAGALQDELKDFRRKVSDAGRYLRGTHDDLVLAVAIALWWATSGASVSVEELRV
jgi:hypothetical protein